MNVTVIPTSGMSHRGHVRNGVVVLDIPISMANGQAVEVIPIVQESSTVDEVERTQQLKRMKEIFAQWAEEDRDLSDEDADVLERALKENRGIRFRSVNLS
jgi:hypothetical protein